MARQRAKESDTPVSGSALRTSGGTHTWRKITTRILRRDQHRCQVAGPDGTPCHAHATVVGHITARADWPAGQPGVDHPSNLRAECATHSSKDGGRVGSRKLREYVAAGRAVTASGGFFGGSTHHPRFVSEISLPEADASPDAADPAWDVAPWLDPLRTVPGGTAWPRYMTLPHPQAVGSYGPAFEAWCTGRGRMLRWWQRLAAYRLLEHDEAGRLVWLTLLLTTPRQVGKSVQLSELALWRITHAQLFGEEQLVVHTGKDMAICQDVQRKARRWARSAGHRVVEANGKEAIETVDGSRWLIRGQGSVYGYAATLALVDEGWGVPAIVVDDGLEPTMADRVSPQLLVASTAHRRATSLFRGRRRLGLGSLATPGDSLLLEWSAPRSGSIEDETGWHAASPYWSAQRERLVRAALARALAGEVDAGSDDDDPVEAFRSQWLNVWPAQLPRSAVDDRLVSAEQVVRGAGPEGFAAPVLVMEDNLGGAGQCVVLADMDNAGVIRVSGRAVASRQWAWQYLRDFRDHPEVWGLRVLVGATLAIDPAALAVAAAARGAGELRGAIGLVRSLLDEGRVVFSDDPEVDELLEALLAARTVTSAAGVSLAWKAGGAARLDLVRAVLWAVAEASVPAREPAIA